MPGYAFTNREDLEFVAEAARDFRRQHPGPIGKQGPNRVPVGKVIVKGDSDVAKGETGSFTFYHRGTAAKGNEVASTDSRQTQTMYVRMGDYVADREAYAEWIDGGWEVTQMECDQ